MSLFPLLSASLSDPWGYPSRAFDRPLGMGLLDSMGDLLSPTGLLMRPLLNADTALSDVKNEPDKFKVMLNVSQFKPNEIDIKTVDNNIVIHGKHEEKTDEHGFISREFTRRYMLPEGTDPKTVKSSLSANGILTIEAPKKAVEPPPSNERIVPITMETPAAVTNK
ncbi:alpha-crystallin B chain-like [Argiope bruennichi]|uniref:Protein lethal(2)essential for life like protein n=1 Tax=Argiope bruennichi TaxID=94029 RepID=A0A8T0FYZ3_ARGBR|nr:alpha-crystallin B chain-like [Argiope bruennichi]KAF8796327.1 Protein lethal(2)essential for life like protein [Argiope bruennichi]